MDQENTQNTSDVEKLQQDLEESRKKCDEYLNNWKRAAADFANYKKDESERLFSYVEYKTKAIILNVLPILDGFDLALKQMPEAGKTGVWVQGLMQIKKQIEAFLQSENVTVMKVANRQFDPNSMEAVQEVPMDRVESGVVVEEVQKGYMIGEKVLRPAKVKISK